MSAKIVYGKHLVIDENTVIPSGALYIEGDNVVDYGTYAEIKERYKAEKIIGSAEALVTPGFVNAHSHGKGLTDFQRGQIDDTLETWKWRSYPPVDPYLDTCLTCTQLLESGVTTTMHNHGLVNPEAYQKEFAAVIEAYKECGLRVAFAPSLSTENVFTYGEDEAFLASLPSSLQELCGRLKKRSGAFGEKEYFQAVRALRREFNSPMVQIMHGPVSPQWVSEGALERIRQEADELSLRIHIHVQQTQLQKLYGLKRFGKSLIAHLADIGFLGKDVTCGHCVWISDSDIELLAETGASVTHHPGCNLRVRNGIAPVFELLQRGVVVAIGMDEKEVADDKDYLAEMRVAAKLHRLPSHELDSPCLGSRDVFRMGTRNGACVLGMDSWIGTLQKGKQADVVVLDLEAMSEPFTYEGHDPLDLLLYRGKAIHVRSVLVGGEVLLEDGKHKKVDKKGLLSRLGEAIPADYSARFREANTLFAELRSAIAKHHAPWYEEIGGWEKNPNYWLNNRS